MILEQKETRILTFPRLKMVDTNGKVLKIKQKHKYILPGLNEVDDDFWSKMKKHKSIQLKLEDGRLVEHFETKEVEKVDKKGEKKIITEKVKDFNKLSNKKKREIISDTYNLDSLKKWEENESEADIRNLILKQIDSIQKSKVNTKIGKPNNTI